MMEVDGDDVSTMESNVQEEVSFDVSRITDGKNREEKDNPDETDSDEEDAPESFGNLSCIPSDDNKDKNENPHDIDTDESECDQDVSMLEASIYDPVDLLEISDILELVGKKWSMFRVSPLWNFNFSTSCLNSLTKKLNDFLIKYISTNLKNQKDMQISVKFELIEGHNDNIALKIVVVNKETKTNLYTGLLLKSPNYAEKLNKNNLSDMPMLLVQGNKMFITSVHNWLTDHFDCVIRPYEFAQNQFLWLIAISMGDAGPSYNENVVYHYTYKYEASKGQMDVECSLESEFLRSTLSKLSLNRSEASSATSFNYVDLIKVQSEIDDFIKITSGINTTKLKLKSFEAPKVASINISGKIHVWSSSLMDLMLNYLMELANNKLL